MENPDLYDLMFIIRSPMNVMNDEHWESGRGAFNFLVQIVEACMDKLKYTDVQIGALSCWAMVHGLVSLNVRERCKVLELVDRDVMDMLMLAVDDFLAMIRR
jgi:hypothetical protein